jgi:tetratricopeptide (TPR) repeat protein
MKRIIGFILLFLFTITLSSAFAVKVEMDVAPKILKLGESGRCTIRIYDVDSPLMPKISSKDFDFVNAGTGSQIRIINGKYEKFQTFTYYFTPKKIGEFTIGPFEYEYKRGKKVKLNAVKIKVVPPTQTKNNNSDKIENYLFGKISSETKNVYKGQTINIFLSIYYKDLNVGNRFRLLELNASGMQLGDFSDLGEKREVVNGDIYTVRQFKVPATITNKDNVSIAPVLGVPIITRNRSNNFFNDPFFDGFNTQTNYINIKFNKLKFNVKEIPIKGRPKSFNGAVGKFDFTANITPTEVNVGEPIKIDFIIKGEGNISFVVPPEINYGDKFKVYEMNLINENISKNGIKGRKLYEQVIIPKSTDIKEIPQITFSYFDPFKEEFKEIKYGPFPITVKGNKNNKAVLIKSNNQNQNTNKDNTTIVRDEILYLKPAPSQINQNNFWKPSVKTVVYGYAPPAIILIILFLYFTYFNKETSVNKKNILKKTLKNIELLSYSDPNFYEKLNKTVENYFREIFNIKEGETPTEDMYMTEDLKKFFNEFSGLMQKIIFSADKPMLSDEEMKKLIKNLKNNLKRHCDKLKRSNILKLTTLLLPVLIINFTFIATVNAISVSDIQQKFVKASKYYDNENYEEAIKIYESLFSEGIRDNALFYNLGNSYFKTNKFGKAILNYKRALFLNPKDSDTKINLKFAEDKIQINENKNALFKFIESYKFSWWFYFSVILFWIIVLNVGIYLKIKNKQILNILLINIILFVFSLYGVYYWNKIRNENRAIIVGKKSVVRYAPVKDAKIYFKIKEGENVTMVNSRNDWQKIIFKGKKGWIKSKDVELIWK